MVSREEVERFVKSQESLHLYKKMQKALTNVLLSLPAKDYHQVTKNLHILSLHEGAIGQAMIFPNPQGGFKVVSIVYVPKMPMNVLRFILAHELGHVHKGRHRLKAGEDEHALEDHADKMASAWGHPPTKDIRKWISDYEKNSRF